MLVCDQEGLITYYNQRATELWGRRPKLVDPKSPLAGPCAPLPPMTTPHCPRCESPMAAAILNSRSTRQEEVMIERPERHTALSPLSMSIPCMTKAANVSAASMSLKILQATDRRSGSYTN